MLCISFVQKLGIVVGPTEPCCAVLTCGPVDRLLAYQSRGRLPMVPTTAFSNSNGPKQDYRSTRSRLAVVSAGCGPSSTRDVTRWWGHRPERAKQLQQQRHQGSVAVGVGPTAPSRTNKQGSPTAEACPRIWPVAFYWSSSGLPLLRRQRYQTKEVFGF